MSSEINNGSFLPGNLEYTRIFDRSTLSDSEDAQVASEVSDLSVLRDALRVARVNGLVDGKEVTPLFRFPAPPNFPSELVSADGTTSLAEVSDWLVGRGTSPYLSSGALAGVQIGGSSTSIGEQIGALEDTISQLSSTRSEGAGAGVSVVDGTFYVDGKVVALADLFVATRLNRAHNAQGLVNQIVEDIEARQKLIEAAQDLNFVLKYFQPTDSDTDFGFVEKTATFSYGRINNSKVSLAHAINEVAHQHGLDKNPLSLFSNVNEITHKFRAAGFDQPTTHLKDSNKGRGQAWSGGYWQYGSPNGVDNVAEGSWATAQDLEDIGFDVTEYEGRGHEVSQWYPASLKEQTASTVVPSYDIANLYEFKGPDIGKPRRIANNKLAQWLNATNNSVQQINSRQERDNLTLDDARQTFGDQLSAISKSDDREQDSNSTIAENL